MALDPGIFGQVGNYKSIADYDNIANQQQANKLALMLQQSQVDQIPLHNQLMQLQLAGQQIGNQKANALLSALGGLGGGQSVVQGGASGGMPTTQGSPGTSPTGFGNLTFGDVVKIKALGGPDLTNDFKLGLEGVSHAPGSEVTAMDGSRRRVAQLNPGETQDSATGAVSNIPGSVEAAAARTAAIKSAEIGVTNANTLAPLDRINPATNQPYDKTVAGLVADVNARNAPAPAAPISSLSQLTPAQQAGAIQDMLSRGQNPSTMKVNAAPVTGDLQAQLDAAKASGPAAMVRFQQTILPQILQNPDPALRQQGLAGFMFDMHTPPGTPMHAMGRQGTSAPAADGGFQGFAGPAQLAAATDQAKADVALRTRPALTYADATAGDAAKYKSSLDDQVANSQQLMSRIGEAQNALTQFKPGMGADTRLQVARFAQSVGAGPELVNRINNGDVAAKQEFVKLSAQTAMESLKQAMGSSGRITQAEFKVFQANNPNIELDPNAIQKIFDFQTKVYQRSLAEQQGFTDFTAKGGDPTKFQAIWARQSDPSGTGQIGGGPSPTSGIPAVVPYKDPNKEQRYQQYLKSQQGAK